MADNKTFDTEKIVNGESMDALDKLYFEKFGAAMDEQAEIIEENLEEYIRYADETYDSVMENLYNNDGQYLVHGARLKCSKMKKEEGQKLVYKEEKLNSEPVLRKGMMDLYVTDTTRKGNDMGLPFANVSDTTGGMRGKLLTEGEELNITSFGNCKFLDEENLKDVEAIAERVYQAYANSSEFTGITYEMVLNGIIEAIRANMGTCYCCMALNYEWENLPVEFDYVDNTFSTERSGAESYFNFNGKEGINMMSMLFCGFGGGIINAEESGQKVEMVEDIFTDLEKDLIAKYSDKFAYDNWSQEKKQCAEEIWRRFYVEGGYDARFVAGLIGNMFGEGSCGILQCHLEGMDWNTYIKDGHLYKGGEIISNIEQARAACKNAPENYGIGMIQWSAMNRKQELFNCYDYYKSTDGSLSPEQLMEAEIEYMFTELANTGNIHNYKDIIQECQDYFNDHDSTGDNITGATCILFRDYIVPGTYKDVDGSDYTVAEKRWEEARNATSGDAVPSICQRIIASKIAYEEFADE